MTGFFPSIFSAFVAFSAFTSGVLAMPVEGGIRNLVKRRGFKPSAGAERFEGFASADSAPLLSSSNADTTGLESEYIVLLQPNTEADSVHRHLQWVKDLSREDAEMRAVDASLDGIDVMSSVKHVYDLSDLGFQGYSGRFSSYVLEQIRQHPDVAIVERDQVVRVQDQIQQSNAPWGLARISHRETLDADTLTKYEYDSSAGEGVEVYIIDTGINTNHTEFEGRAVWGKTIPTGDADVDGNGHGTHVAGTVASRAYGVAKKAKVIAVKVLRSNGSGTMSDVISGIEWAVKDYIRKLVKGKKNTSIANMSLGGGRSIILDFAVDVAVRSGVSFAVAAGNEDDDACYSSPAASNLAITVGASTINDARAYFSNYGDCVDVFAPGLNILSTWIGSNVSTNIISGTSMATPHIAGLAAYLVGLNDTLSVYDIKDLILDLATKDVLYDIPADTPNLLAYNGISA
ncbi:vacuolar serine protease Isp6 [Schizosaccharomyces japonicus yFS275]|uniref:Vacuolar serine protease Isp6 n=1 Tax=Schizosaccharomyces japonicus (strain yFS275 / FY16936) TaxID=402676 RepID=B6K2G3_SCHJY|nr:vacuolar serine protease Isp6 [Schizosaccharomyces japonicus yFS275]EEB07344.1 vacuolar serine protease Isp6 [Schizosaccharomyces japonicus yFS275]